jgi:predicted DNA-binding protein (MmcQ/YjbR family)
MAKAPLDLIRSLCEKYPQWEKAFLFGDHEVYRVNKKVYVWLGEGEKGGTYVSVKLKDTQGAALMLPFVKPASYGMAKWGWVGAEFPKGPLPESLVAEWIEESYRHTAPKKLLKILAADRSEVAVAPVAAKKKKRAVAKKKR